MPVEWGVIVPLFLLMLLIACFLIYLWYYKKFPSNQDEGFQVALTTNRNSVSLTNSTYQTIYGNITRVQGSSAIWGSRLGSQSRLGGPTSIIWPTTPLDSSYDAYWESELIARNELLKTIPPIMPPDPVSQIGMGLADFDPLNPSIPWDQDNSASNPDPSSCTWGRVHPEASKSIFLKNYIMNLIQQPPPPGCDPNSIPYCYASPMLNVQTTNAGWGNFIQYGVEGVGTAVGDAMATSEPVRNAIGRGLQRVASIAGSPIWVVAGKIGFNIAYGFGEKVIQKALSRVQEKIDDVLGKVLVAKIQLRAAQSGIYAYSAAGGLACATGLAITTKAAAAGGPLAVLAVITIGVPLCLAIYGLQTATLFVISNLMIVLLITQTIVPILVSSAYKTGGTCPPGFQELHDYITPQVQAILGMFVPGFGMLESVFQPYLCFKKDSWQMVLKQPPKTPSFMLDRTLSLTYHADWLTSHSSQSPEPSLYYTMIDPPPPCFTTFPNSDLASSPNTSDIARWARETNIIGTALTSGSSLQNPISQLLYVKKCPLGTTPSLDGKHCNQIIHQIVPIQPTLTACDGGQRDDGTNCITIASEGTNCTGGTITYIPSSIWDPRYGYNKLTQSEYRCNGVVVPIPGKSYRDRMVCPAGYEHNGVDELLCYPKCTPPAANTPDTCNPTIFTYNRVGATCQSSVQTTNRQIMYATATNYVQNQPYNPVLSLSDIKFPYCDFSSPVMLDRMAQFYYDKSFTNPATTIDDSGNILISVQYITKFYSVIASSEMSCDVICEILFVSFDLVTGGNYSSTRGCADAYSTDKTGWKGCPFCFRRFYFVHDPADPQGVFTVTACTMGDYTASSAMVKSTDFYVNIPVGLSPLSAGNVDQLGRPSAKKWVQNDHEVSIVDPAAFANSALQTSLNLIFGLGAFGAMMAGQQMAVIAAGQIGLGPAASMLAGIAFMTVFSVGQTYAEAALNKCSLYHIPPNQINGQNGQFILGNRMSYTVMTNNDWFTIDHGPIYELSRGYEPNIEWCRTSYVSSEYCSHKYVVRDMVNYYHLVSPLKHIKQIIYIEPRGLKPESQGCYYKWKEVDYDPITNLETETLQDKEIIVPTTIKEYSTCAYTMVKNGQNTFNTNVSDPNFALRSFIDPATREPIYPTRRLTYTSDLLARFIRIRPSLLSGDGFMNITQIRVYDTSGNLVSSGKKVTATSTSSISFPATSVTNGKINVGTKVEQVWKSGKGVPGTPGALAADAAEAAGAPERESEYITFSTGDTEYLEVDLEDMVAISYVEYYGSSIPLALIGTETYPTNARSLVNARNAAVKVAAAARAGTIRAAELATSSHPVTAWEDNLRNSINNEVNNLGNSIVNSINNDLNTVNNALALNSITRINNQAVGLPPPPSQLIQNAVAASTAESIAYDAEKAAIAAASIYRNYGVRIQFLYNNKPDEVPIFEYTLPIDKPIQTIKVYSSSTNVPASPISGPINIPRPLGTAKYLGAPDCPYKCEDKPVIDSLVQQYNSINPDSKIISVLNGTTGSSGTTGTEPSCEYEVELVGTDESGGWKGSKGSIRKAQSITREYITMNLQSNIVRPSTNVFGRFVVVKPSFTEGTVLEISKLLVYTYDRTACGESCKSPTLGCTCIKYRNNARNQGVNFFNGVLSLAYSPTNAQSVVDGTTTPQPYINTNLAPPLFIAASNDPATFFQVDLGRNLEIYQIVFVGRSDSDRTPGGIVGIKLEVFTDQPSNQMNATDGTFPAVFSHSLLTDKCTQTINVVPIPRCSYTVMSSNKMIKPIYIQKNSPGFSAPDTSGGVFTFNSVMGSLRTLMNSILPANAADPLVPVTQNMIQTGKLLGNIRDTISMSNPLLGTTHKCSDPAILEKMMTAYNILHSPSPTKQFSVAKKSIIQVLKAGPSSPNACDLLFEEKYDIYSDYIIDATGVNTGKAINAARFIFTKDGGAAGSNSISVSPDSTRIYDISSNAVGIISDATILNPIFRGPARSVDCRDPTVVSAMIAAIKSADTIGSKYNSIAQTFQSSPLSCEYTIMKEEGGNSEEETFVRAIFTLPKNLVSAVEYYPDDITSTDEPGTKTKFYAFRSAPRTRIQLPNLFTYDATRPSSRVNNNEIPITNN